MNTYRVLVLLSDGFWSRHTIECENDAEATLRAINMGPGQMQVWHGNRLVSDIRGSSHYRQQKFRTPFTPRERNGAEDIQVPFRRADVPSPVGKFDSLASSRNLPPSLSPKAC